MGGVDILLLALLGATAKQDDESVPVLAEIDPVAGAKIYPAFKDTSADSFGVRKIALFDSDQGCRHLGGRAGIQPIESPGVGTAALGIDIFPDLNHTNKVT